MGYGEYGGLPGIHKRHQHEKAVASAPGAVRRNKKRIFELKEQVRKLEQRLIQLEKNA